MVSTNLRLKIARWLFGWEPHSTQEEWLLAGARTKVAACGRRWGKTEAASVDAATMALAEPGSVQMIVAPAVRRAVKVTRTPYPRLTFGASLITARTADEDGRNLRGHSADRVIIDEAAYVRDHVIQEVIAPMLADRDGRLVMVSTPFGKNHFYRAFLRGVGGGEGNYASFTFPSASNPHISGEYIERQRAELSKRQFEVEYEARFVDEVASVFSWEEINAAAEARFSGLERSDRFDAIVAGIDWARYSDYTAVVALGVSSDRCEVVAIDRFNGLDWRTQVERVTDFLKNHRVSAVLTDQTSVGDALLEQLRAKLWEDGADMSIEGYYFTNQSKRDLIENLGMRFSQGTISIPRDETLMKELQYFEYELTQSGNVRMNARTGCHDDLVIALALACRQAKSTVGSGTVGVYSRNGRVAVGGW